jgi:hypothetical protein
LAFSQEKAMIEEKVMIEEKAMIKRIEYLLKELLI